MIKDKGIEKRIIDYININDKDRALSLIMENYTGALLNISHGYLNDRDLAKDALQESMYKIWLKMDSFDNSKSGLYTWMCRIVINKSIDLYRTRSLALDKFFRDTEDYSYIDFHHSHSINVDVLDLEDNLNKLPNKYRDVIYYSYFKGLTNEGISVKLNIPLGTVKGRYKIGLRELRKIYSINLQ